MSFCLSDSRLSVPRASVHTNSPNGVFRMAIVPVVYGWDLSEEERADFDYLVDDVDNEEQWMDCGASFFRYRGEVYDLGEFVRIVPQGGSDPNGFAHYDHSGTLKGWDGIATDSHFSGVVVKYISDELLQVGLYCC